MQPDIMVHPFIRNPGTSNLLGACEYEADFNLPVFRTHIHAGSPSSQDYNQIRHNPHSNLLHPKKGG
jgi:hypothetical protein